MAITNLVSRSTIHEQFIPDLREKKHSEIPVPILMAQSLESWWDESKLVVSGWASFQNLFLIPPPNKRGKKK
ncbi:MAG: hypothetical protein DRO88_02345 [Promethearchaeia archaeon]|nr:MAG: hypothetical protein DRO88_02345 [Candidatus Lokiarchaeia archaeon]